MPEPLPADLQQNAQFHETFLPLPGGHLFWIASVYCFDQGQDDHLRRTDGLLQAVVDRMGALPQGTKLVAVESLEFFFRVLKRTCLRTWE